MASVCVRLRLLCAAKPLVESKNVALKFCLVAIGEWHGLFNFYPRPPGGSGGHPKCPQRARSEQNLVRSKIVINKSCYTCFSDDKNVFDIITRPPGGTREGGVCSGGHFKSWWYGKMLLSKVVPHTSVMTKMHSGSSPDPPGGLGGPRNPWGGHFKILPDQEMLLIKVVPHTSVMTKKQSRVTKPLRRS